MNNTLKVMSVLDCHGLGPAYNAPLPDPDVRQIVVVCRLLLMLQQMYNFSIVYEYGALGMELHGVEEWKILDRLRNGSLDLYTRSMSLRSGLLDYAEPVQEIYKWRLGFILRRSDFGLFGSFFRDPFHPWVWYCVYLTTFLTVVLFYMLRRVEARLVRCKAQDECTVSHEIMVTLASISQTNVPTNPILSSRRTAYVTYFMFNYIMYTFYTSNLLYHLVNVRTNQMDLDGLTESDYKCVILNITSFRNIFNVRTDNKVDKLVDKKFTTIEFMDSLTGLEAVKAGKTAILSDYLSLYPILKSTFDDEIACQLVEVDLLSNLKKFMWISKSSLLKEKIRIGILRIKEIGVLVRMSRVREPLPPGCVSTGHVRAYLKHIMAPLATLATTFFIAILILLGERMYAYRHLPFPYTD